MKKSLWNAVAVILSVIVSPVSRADQVSKSKIEVTHENLEKLGLDRIKLINLIREQNLSPEDIVKVIFDAEAKTVDLSDLSGRTILVNVDQVSIAQPNARD